MAEIIAHPAVSGLRRMFLLVTPNETSFETLEQVPQYVDEAVPYFFGLILLECVLLFCQGKPLPRLNDSYTSLANGLLSILHSLLFRSTELVAFMWVYERYNIITLPWNNPWTWILCLLGTDLAYYWVHRFGHECNIMWAAHQTHHGSQEYNLTTALRQSMFQKYCAWLFYMPLALFLPPSIFLVHTQFNLIYQFWVHTEIIKSLGPLEWILSTPSHHRVHHGRNPYCIDKNYGGIFIIWDRLFGTFEAEKDDEKPVYGLVHNLKTWNPIKSQFCHLEHIVKTFRRVKGLGNKLSVIFKGPGWSPGKPRLGLPEDIPQVESPEVKYNTNVPLLKSVYIWFHYFLILLYWHPYLVKHKEEFSWVFMLYNVILIAVSLGILGSIFDNRPRSRMPLIEAIRCIVFVINAFYLPDLPNGKVVSGIYFGSAVFWELFSLNRVRHEDSDTRKDGREVAETKKDK